jgi:hypothetical protein
MALAVFRGDADGAIGVRKTMVPSEEGQGQGPRKRGLDRGGAQVGVGLVRRGIAGKTLRALMAVFPEGSRPQSPADEATSGTESMKQRKKGYYENGGSAPKPPGFSAWRQSRRDKKRERGRMLPPPSPVLAPGSALGSVPTGTVRSMVGPILRPGQDTIARKSNQETSIGKENHPVAFSKSPAGLRRPPSVMPVRPQGTPF